MDLFTKMMSLLFNMLSRIAIAFLPRSKHLLISWLHSPSAVIFGVPANKFATVSPSISHEVMGPVFVDVFKEEKSKLPVPTQDCIPGF